MIILYRNASILSRIDPLSLTCLARLLSVSVAVHGLSHLELNSMVISRCHKGSLKVPLHRVLGGNRLKGHHDEKGSLL